MAITGDSLLRTPTRTKVILVVIGIVVILFFYWWSLYSPKREQRDNLRAQRDKSVAELALLEKLSAEIPNLEREIARLSAKFAEAKEILPEKKEIPSLLTSISTLGRDSGLEFLLFKPRPEVHESSFAKIPVEISVSGGFHDVARFFDKVSKLPRIVSITNLAVKQPRDRKLYGQFITVKGMATTYRLLTEAEAEAVAVKKAAEEKKKRRARRARGG